MKCDFCGKDGIISLKVPSSVKTNKKGRIIKVFKDDRLPVCEEHFRFLKSKTIKKYNWIEKILERKYIDGRKRLTNLVLLPYLSNVLELPDKLVIKKMMEWYDLCNYSKELWKLKKELEYVKRREYLPITKNNLKEKYGEFPWTKK